MNGVDEHTPSQPRKACLLDLAARRQSLWLCRLCELGAAAFGLLALASAGLGYRTAARLSTASGPTAVDAHGISESAKALMGGAIGGASWRWWRSCCSPSPCCTAGAAGGRSPSAAR